MTLPPFYPIFDSADWLARMLPTGIRFVQLRIKDQPEAVLRQEIVRARELCTRANAQLVVNDYWQLAIEEGCDFVHLGQEDLDGADLAAIRRAGIRLGVSTHDEAELDRALATEPDYVALGPIYPTTLKEMKHPPQGLERIATWKARIGALPLVAIGGITLERNHDVLAAGADSISLVTDLTLNPDPEARARAWVEAMR